MHPFLLPMRDTLLILLLLTLHLPTSTSADSLLSGTSCTSASSTSPSSTAPLSRPCTYFERTTTLDGTRATCPCPGPTSTTPTKRFYLEVTTLVLPNPLLPSLNKTYFVVNGTTPGPQIEANEGDWVEVTLLNSLPPSHASYTTLHFHGIHHVLTPYSDGVLTVTQCPLPASSSLTYTFRASTPGTYWYHGHTLTQYPDGLIGALIIHPAPTSPAVFPPHDDSLTLLVGDFFSLPARTLVTDYYLTPQSKGAEPIPDAITVNGQFSSNLEPPAPPSSLLHLPIANRTGKTLFRVIASNTITMFDLAIDGVGLSVVEVDATPVHPLTVPFVTLNVGQRVAFLVDWGALPTEEGGQPLAAVFLRISAHTSMYPLDIRDPGSLPPYAKAIGAALLNPLFLGSIQFSPFPLKVQPTYTDPPSTPLGGLLLGHKDFNLMAATPVLPAPIPGPPTHQLYLELGFKDDEGGVNRGYFNGVTHTHHHEGGKVGGSNHGNGGLTTPSLFQYAAAGGGLASSSSTPTTTPFLAAYPYGPTLPYPGAPTHTLPAIPFDSQAHYTLPLGAHVVVFINNTDSGGHPIHTHGHSFWVLASSDYSPPHAQTTLPPSPIRRDVVNVAAKGWAAIAFIADNPGVWTMHCHVDFHLSGGLMVELHEGTEALVGLPIPEEHRELCAGGGESGGGGGGSGATPSADPFYPLYLGTGVAAVGGILMLSLGALWWKFTMVVRYQRLKTPTPAATSEHSGRDSPTSGRDSP